MRPLPIQTSGQGSETLGLEDFPHSGRAQGTAALLEQLADLINRVVLFAQLHDELAGGRLLGLGLRAVARGDEKDWIGLAAEVVAEDVKGVERVAKGAGDVLGRAPLNQISTQGLVLAVFRQAGFKKEAAEFT